MSANALGKRKAKDEETPAAPSISHSSTLFVSNLPYDATSTDLQTAFSDLAPVRSAFVVLEHSSGVSKGVGYVSFSIKEDAQTAFESLTTHGMAINGRNVRVQWAESKTKDRPKVENAKKEKETPVRSLPLHKVNDPLAIQTIVVSGLPPSIDQKSLWKKLRKFEGAENVEWPAKTPGGEDVSTAHVLFSSSSLAQDAVSKLHAHVFKGSLLSVTLKKRLDNLAKTTIKKTTSGTAPSRASRLIVRNLPFNVTEQDLRAIFLPYGPIHSIHIPQAEVGDVKTEADAEHEGSSKAARSKGFAFVWMLSKKDAESALEKCNGMKVVAGMASDIRVIAVDWALSKERWVKEKEKLAEPDDDVEKDMEIDDAERDASASEDGEADSELEQLGIHEEGSGDEGGEDEDEDEDEDDGEDSDGDSPKKPQLPHTDTGNTLFIRNIPFTATEDEIRTLFRAFGPLRYVRLTVEPETERPRGTGFACFWNKEDADKAIKQSEILRAETMGTQTQPLKNPFSLPSLLTPDPSAGVAKNLVLHGRTLDVVHAVTREQATKLKEDGEKSREKADKRNLYLLREGVILPNSSAAETIPQVELEKRTNSFNARRTMLRSNPSLYVSKTRLSIRQIPLFVTERVLKRLAIHSVREFNAEVKKGIREALSPDELAEPAEVDDQDGKNVIKAEHDSKLKKRKAKGVRPTSVKQAKIVRQSDRVDPVTGKGRSRGYGFIEMHTHADALRVLRWANNNADIGVLFDKWWKEELADLLKEEKSKESQDKARVKRMKDEMEAPSKPAKGTLIAEFSIENIQVVKRRTAQKEKLSQSHHARRPSPSTEEPPSKKRRISSDQTKPVKTMRLKEEPPKPGKIIGSVIGRKRRSRKAGKSAR
ncbi:RNA-binding domain-containing protein [Imleria badia]|nr:RNA-binding domain-containing protein [Imleria badia]